MSFLNKFPYKSMIPIMKAISSVDKPLDIYEIQKVTHACLPDTTEVTYMLTYLTSFGKVTRLNNGWVRKYEQYVKPKKTFRGFYLKEILALIENLDEIEPKTTKELANQLNFSEDMVNDYLPFLEKITYSGYLNEEGNKFPPEFSLIKYFQANMN